MTHTISLQDALLSNQIEVENIDWEKIKILIDEMITPQLIKIIPNKGMPIFSKDPAYLLNPLSKRGNLKVKFDIEFPSNLSQDQKDQLTAVLSD